MKKSCAIKFLLIILPVFSFGQVDHTGSFQIVLHKAQMGKLYSFDRSKGTDLDRLDLVYLGKIKTQKGKVLKILTSRWYWGQAPRATSRIIIFNQKNQYLGDYHLTMTYEVPDRIEKSSLVFEIDKMDGSKYKPITKINFGNGIPKRFFLKIEESGAGDIYSFEQNL